MVFSGIHNKVDRIICGPYSRGFKLLGIQSDRDHRVDDTYLEGTHFEGIKSLAFDDPAKERAMDAFTVNIPVYGLNKIAVPFTSLPNRQWNVASFPRNPRKYKLCR